MAELFDVLNGNDRQDVAAALYYASRYIKQADHLKRYNKNIFDDDDRSAPSERVVLLTWKIVAWLEAAEDKPAEKFDTETLTRAMSRLSQVGRLFRVELTDEELRAAQAAIDHMSVPKTANG